MTGLHFENAHINDLFNLLQNQQLKKNFTMKHSFR